MGRVAVHNTNDNKAHLVGVQKLWINHNGDWSGEVYIGWLEIGAPEPRSLCVDGPSLVRGLLRAASPRGAVVTDTTIDQVPVAILVRAATLAACAYWQRRMLAAAEQIWVTS